MALVPGARRRCACTVVVRNQLPGTRRRCRSTQGMSTPNVVVPGGTVSPEVPAKGHEDTSESEKFPQCLAPATVPQVAGRGRILGTRNRLEWIPW
jgi:hypothetical protein